MSSIARSPSVLYDVDYVWDGHAARDHPGRVRLTELVESNAEDYEAVATSSTRDGRILESRHDMISRILRGVTLPGENIKKYNYQTREWEICDNETIEKRMKDRIRSRFKAIQRKKKMFTPEMPTAPGVSLTEKDLSSLHIGKVSSHSTSRESLSLANHQSGLAQHFEEETKRQEPDILEIGTAADVESTMIPSLSSYSTTTSYQLVQRILSEREGSVTFRSSSNEASSLPSFMILDSLSSKSWLDQQSKHSKIVFSEDELITFIDIHMVQSVSSGEPSTLSWSHDQSTSSSTSFSILLRIRGGQGMSVGTRPESRWSDLLRKNLRLPRKSAQDAVAPGAVGGSLPSTLEINAIDDAESIISETSIANALRDFHKILQALNEDRAEKSHLRHCQRVMTALHITDTVVEVWSRLRSELGPRAFTQMGEECSFLLNLRQCDIDNDRAKALAAAFRIPSFAAKISDLDLNGNHIGDAGTMELARALCHNTTLTRLSLAHNQIGHVGAAEIAKMLKQNSTLQELRLYGNNIGNSVVEKIARVLSVNSSLTLLNLARNQIDDTGAAGLAKALQRNSTLQKLHLCGNRIGSNGASALAQSLLYNSALKDIDFEGNQIGIAGAWELAKALDTNCTLKFMSLCHNFFDHDFLYDDLQTDRQRELLWSL